MARRVHRTIDRVPAGVRDTAMRMIVDDEWPDGMTGEGKPTYDDVAAWLAAQGHPISISAIGRWGIELKALAKDRKMRELARRLNAARRPEELSETQRAAADMMTALVLDAMIRNDSMSPRDMRNVTDALKGCTTVAINADKYIREQVEARLQKAAKKTRSALKASGVDRKKIQEIIDEFLGVTKS